MYPIRLSCAPVMPLQFREAGLRNEYQLDHFELNLARTASASVALLRHEMG